MSRSPRSYSDGSGEAGIRSDYHFGTRVKRDNVGKVVAYLWFMIEVEKISFLLVIQIAQVMLERNSMESGGDVAEIDSMLSSFAFHPVLLIVLIIGCCAFIGLAFIGSRLLGWPFAPAIAAALSLWGVVMVMFFAGGRTLDSFGLYPSLLDSCVTGDTTSDFLAFDTQAVLNAALYTPFAFSFTLTLRRWPRSLLICIVLIFFLEISQGIMNRGVCSESDIAQNLVGAVFGVGIAAALLAHKARKA